MKRIIIALAIAASSFSTYAACTTHTYFINGKVVICQVCCIGTSCTTTCF